MFVIYSSGQFVDILPPQNGRAGGSSSLSRLYGCTSVQKGDKIDFIHGYSFDRMQKLNGSDLCTFWGGIEMYVLIRVCANSFGGGRGAFFGRTPRFFISASKVSRISSSGISEFKKWLNFCPL